MSGGATSTFQVTAWKVAAGDDDFVFSYSTDGGSSWTTMNSTLITSTSAQTVTYDLTGVSGPVVIRVVDTVRSGGNPSLDEITIDHLVVINS